MPWKQYSQTTYGTTQTKDQPSLASHYFPSLLPGATHDPSLLLAASAKRPPLHTAAQVPVWLGALRCHPRWGAAALRRVGASRDGLEDRRFSPALPAAQRVSTAMGHGLMRLQQAHPTWVGLRRLALDCCVHVGFVCL